MYLACIQTFSVMVSKKIKGAGFILWDRVQARVLVVQGRKSKKFGFPKGHTDPTDSCLLDCAIRETLEETGYCVNPVYSYYFAIKSDEYVYLLAPAEHILNPKVQHPNTPEIRSCQWMSIHSFAALGKMPRVCTAAVRGLFRKQKTTRWGHYKVGRGFCTHPYPFWPYHSAQACQLDFNRMLTTSAQSHI